MSTRSLTVFLDEHGHEIVVLYRHSDGYPEWHGKELAEFLIDLPLTDGIVSFTQRGANGMGCLAAQVIAHFKTSIGNFYLYPAGTRDCDEQYIYTVSGRVGKPIWLACSEVRFPAGGPRTEELLFSGTAESFLTWLKGEGLSWNGMP